MKILGHICEKHPELNGLRYKAANTGPKCVGCQAVLQRKRREDPKKVAADAERYRLKKKRRDAEMRVPKWVDHEKIKAIYQEAKTKGMVVDHYYPLRGLLVTGLHVAENLRVVTYEENASKSNKMPED